MALASELKQQGLRVEVDDSTESVGKKIRNAEKGKVPCMLVVGDKEAEGGPLTVRVRGEADQKTMDKADFIAECLNSIKQRLA
jgi:threonyl-tRNA synthetase